MPLLPANRILINSFLLLLSAQVLGCSTANRENRAINQHTQRLEQAIQRLHTLQAPTEPETAQPSHLMTSTSRRTARIRMRLKHGSPSETHWAKANMDAQSKCREWGYKEAEVTGTNHAELIRTSFRTYECIGKALESPKATASDRPETPDSDLIMTETPIHNMTLSFPKMGVIQMQLTHQNPSGQHWTKADNDALAQCHQWGYETVEVDSTVMNVRDYRCRGRYNPGVADQRTHQDSKSQLTALVELQRQFAAMQSHAERGNEEARRLLAITADRQAKLQRRAETGDVQAQGDLAFIRLLTSEKQLQVETWRCFPLLHPDTNKPAITLTRLTENGEQHPLGEVSVSGTSHFAEFRVTGIDLRWNFGEQDNSRAYPYAFVIRPDGTGAYYDFSASVDGRAGASQVFTCKLSPQH